MVIGFMALALLSHTSLELLKYIINVPLALYAILYLIKYKFAYKVFERVLSSVQDALIIAIFNIFVIEYKHVSEYGLDFYAIAIVGIIEIIEVIIKLVRFCKRGNDDDDDAPAEVVPEKDGRGVEKDRKNNSFGAMDNITPEASYDNLHLNNSGVSNSPRRAPAGNKRR